MQLFHSMINRYIGLGFAMRACFRKGKDKPLICILHRVWEARKKKEDYAAIK